TPASLNEITVEVWFPDGKGNELSYSLPINEVARSQDGKWYTFSVNLTQLTNENIRLSTYADFLAGEMDGAKQLRLFIQNPTLNDIDAVIGIDNIRVVRAVM